MTLWKLTPVDTYHRDWNASAYNGEVIVRAADERTARLIASSAFGCATHHVVGELISVIPWDQRQRVACEEYNGTEYSADGVAEIVGPEEALHLLVE